MSSSSSSSFSALPLSLKMLPQQQQQQPQQQQQLQQQLQQQQLMQQIQTQPQDDLFSFSPDSLYNYSLEEYNNFATSGGGSSINYGTDFSADSPLSLGSPVSPVTTTHPYILSSHDELDPWTTLSDSPDADDFAFAKPEPIASPLLFATAFPLSGRILSVSPAIDPVQLSNHNSDVSSISINADQQQTVLPAVNTAAASTTAAKSINMPARDRRYAVRKPSAGLSTGSNSSSSNSNSNNNGSKRKSTSPASSVSRSPRSPSSASSTTRRLQQQQQLQQQKQQQQVKQEEDDEACEPPKKTAHNLIEKRYRTNLNDKILALRDVVPSLRVTVRRVDAAGADSDEDEFAGADGGAENNNMDQLGGLTPAHKLNKATILSKAAEYIAHLERRNEALVRETASLRSKVSSYELLVMNHGAQEGTWC